MDASVAITVTTTVRERSRAPHNPPASGSGRTAGWLGVLLQALRLDSLTEHINKYCGPTRVATAPETTYIERERAIQREIGRERV